MTTSKESERKVIISKARGMRFESEFFLEIQAAILDGYRIAEATDKRDDMSMRNFQGKWGRAVLYKAVEGQNDVKEVPAAESKKEEHKPSEVATDTDSGKGSEATNKKPATRRRAKQS